jgi:hypothetical protein
MAAPLTIQDEVERNLRMFEAHLPQLLMFYRGKYVLLRHETIIATFDTGRDAYLAGRLLYEDQLFSFQEVVDKFPFLKFSGKTTLLDAR